MSKLNEDIIIRYLENRCSEEDFVLINEWMKESDENAGELFRMEEIYQLGKFPFEEENLVAKAERRLGRRLEQENQKRQEVFKLRSVLRYAAAIVGVMVLAAHDHSMWSSSVSACSSCHLKANPALVAWWPVTDPVAA
mgnify:CR=1 FL=1